MPGIHKKTGAAPSAGFAVTLRRRSDYITYSSLLSNLGEHAAMPTISQNINRIL